MEVWGSESRGDYALGFAGVPLSFAALSQPGPINRGGVKDKVWGSESRGSYALGFAGVSLSFANLSQSSPINRGGVKEKVWGSGAGGGGKHLPVPRPPGSRARADPELTITFACPNPRSLLSILNNVLRVIISCPWLSTFMIISPNSQEVKGSHKKSQEVTTSHKKSQEVKIHC